jgi:hypothetical protein
MSELLQPGAMHQPLAPETHPDVDQLSAFMERALPESLRLETLAHLSVCAHCRDILALAMPEALPQFVSEPAKVASKSWFGGWWLGLAAGAFACALLALVFLHLRQGSPVRVIEHAPERAKIEAPVLPEVAPRIRGSKVLPSVKKVPLPVKHAAAAPPSTKHDASPVVDEDVPSVNATGSASIGPPRAVAGLAISSAARTPSMTEPQPAASQAAAGKQVQAVDASPSREEATLRAPRAGALRLLGRSSQPAIDGMRAAQPLPSHLPIISISSNDRETVAIDTEHHLYVSDDAGTHWISVAGPWTGRLVRVSLLREQHTPQSEQTSNAVATGAPRAPAANRARGEGALQGTVRDTTGAVIPGATVEAICSDPPVNAETTADRNGNFSIANLPPGAYRLEVNSPGFEVDRVPVSVTKPGPTNADITLKVGTSTETVTVTSADSLDSIDTASVASLAPAAEFEVTTDLGERWTSADGRTWTKLVTPKK